MLRPGSDPARPAPGRPIRTGAGEPGRGWLRRSSHQSPLPKSTQDLVSLTFVMPKPYHYVVPAFHVIHRPFSTLRR